MQTNVASRQKLDGQKQENLGVQKVWQDIDRSKLAEY